MRLISMLRATLGAALLFMVAGSASAQSLLADSGWAVDADAIFFQLATQHGTRTDVADFDAGHRLALSYMGESKVGVRTTWTDWDHAYNDIGGRGFVSLDTYNIDLEVFKRLSPADRTILELSGGIRYNNTSHFFGVTEPSHFDGIGGLFGIKGGVEVCCDGLLYATAKHSVLMGDGQHDGNALVLNPAFDQIRSQTELGFGYEHRLCVGGFEVVPRVGMEWQTWDGYSIDPVDEHPDTNLGLFGFITGVGVNF